MITPPKINQWYVTCDHDLLDVWRKTTPVPIPKLWLTANLPDTPPLELFCMSLNGQEGAQAACRYCHWVMLYAVAKQVPTTVMFIDPKNKPAWFLAFSEKPSFPIARHNNELLLDSKSIVEYIKRVWVAPSLVAVDGHESIAKWDTCSITDRYGWVGCWGD